MAVAYEHIRRNQRNSLLWAASLPVSFALAVWSGTVFTYMLLACFKYISYTNIWSWSDIWRSAFLSAHETCLWLVPLCVGVGIFWAWQGWQQGDQIILACVRARPLPKFEYEELYALLDTLCLRSGTPQPRVYVLDDDSMNAFSIGMAPWKAGIILSSGLIKNLSRVELEAVLAHELVHVKQYDPRAMAMLVMGLGFFTFAGEYLLYGEDPYDPHSGQFTRQLKEQFSYTFMAPFFSVGSGLRQYIGLLLLAYGYLLAPFLRAGFSAARELQTDADAVLMTRYPKGLRDALWHIDQDSRLEILDRLSLVGVMCIERPSGPPSLLERLSGATKAYPALEERLKALHDMDGMFDPI